MAACKASLMADMLDLAQTFQVEVSLSLPVSERQIREAIAQAYIEAVGTLGLSDCPQETAYVYWRCVEGRLMTAGVTELPFERAQILTALNYCASNPPPGPGPGPTPTGGSMFPLFALAAVVGFYLSATWVFTRK